MTNREEVIEYFKSIEKEKFLYDGKKQLFHGGVMKEIISMVW